MRSREKVGAKMYEHLILFNFHVITASPLPPRRSQNKQYLHSDLERNALIPFDDAPYSGGEGRWRKDTRITTWTTASITFSYICFLSPPACRNHDK